MQFTSTAPPSQSANNRWHSAMLLVLAVIIVYESLYLLAIPTAVIQQSLGFVLLAVVITSALKYSMTTALVAAVLSNIYLVFAFAGPGRTISSFSDMLGGEWLLLLLFFAPAILVGYLSDKIKTLIQKERLAKEQAEHERQRLVATIEQMPVGVVIAQAPAGNIILSNKHLEQITGSPAAKHNDSLHAPPFTLLDPKNGQPLPETDRPLIRVLKNQEAVVDEEYIYEQEDGNRLNLKVNAVPIYNNSDVATSGLVIIDDITSQKESEQQKDDFLSMVSHELKTPVTSIKMFSQMLYKQAQSGQPGHLLDSLSRVNEQANRLQRLIDDILYLAKVQSDNLEYHFEEVEINQLVSEVVKDIKAIKPRYEIIYTPSSSAKVAADYDRLSQVIINLITNAIKYSPNSKKITVSLIQADNQVKIAVQDNGLGVAKREQKRIFERYYQARQSDGSTYPGLGIGLYFSARVISQHQGKIWVESQKGRGSTFYISLPLLKQ